MNPLLPLALTTLLAACSSQTPAPDPQPLRDAPSPVQETTHQPGLRGTLVGAAPGALVEVALLRVDQRGRPVGLISQQNLRAEGSQLTFNLPTANTQAPNTAGQLELRARVSQSGRLIQRLPARRVQGPLVQDLGALQLVPAP